MKGWLDNFGKAENANDSKVSLSEGFVGMGNDTTGRNYSPAWSGQFQTGGSIPGSVGFTYARTAGSAPSEGKYAKKTLPSAEKGKEIQKPIDSTLENVFEIFDPTGISSWDDIYQSYQESGMSPETKYEIFGALPILGKVGKAGKLLSQTSKVNRGKGVMGKGIGAMIQSVPYIGRGTDVLQTVQQAPEASFFPTAPSVNVGQFGRYAGSPSLDLRKSEVLPARTDVHAGSLQKISDYMNSKSEKRSNEVYGRKSYYSPSEFQNGGEMKFYQEGLDWKPKSMQNGGGQIRSGNTLDDSIVNPLIKGVSSVMDYAGGKINDALQYFTDLQKAQLYSTYPAVTAKVHGKINNWLFNNVRPVEYPGIMSGVKNISMGLLNMNAPPEKDSEGLYSIGDEAWQKSLGKTEQPMQSHYIVPSKHRPSDSKDSNGKYYTLKEGVINPQLLIEEARKRNLKDNDVAFMPSLAPFIREGFMPEDEFSQIDPIQKFKLSKGRDEKGEYVSIYDKYDFDGPLNSIITPYEWYDKFYINDQSQLKPSKPSKKKEGGVIKDNRGQWDHPGEVTEIDSNYITMGPDPITGKKIKNNVIGVSNTGDTKLMKPGKNYKFKGKKVTEYPVGKNGINQLDAQPKKKLDDLLNFTNYNKPASSGWLDKFN